MLSIQALSPHKVAAKYPLPPPRRQKKQRRLPRFHKPLKQTPLNPKAFSLQALPNTRNTQSLQADKRKDLSSGLRSAPFTAAEKHSSTRSPPFKPSQDISKPLAQLPTPQRLHLQSLATLQPPPVLGSVLGELVFMGLKGLKGLWTQQ